MLPVIIIGGFIVLCLIGWLHKSCKIVEELTQTIATWPIHPDWDDK